MSARRKVLEVITFLFIRLVVAMLFVFVGGAETKDGGQVGGGSDEDGANLGDVRCLGLGGTGNCR